MAGWHHRLDGYEFEWTPGVGDGQGGLVCYGSWGCKESDRTERLNWTELTHQRMDRHNYYNVLLFGRKSTWIIDKCYNLEETWKHSEWKQSVINHHILMVWYHLCEIYRIGKTQRERADWQLSAGESREEWQWGVTG